MAAGRFVAGAVAVTAVASGLRAGQRVRRMRVQATTVRPLDHDVDLPGRFPPRWCVVLGDSAAAGHGLSDADDSLARRIGRGLLAADGRATAVRCVATDGATTADVLNEQLDAAQHAEVVVIGVGVNDASGRQSVARAAATLRELFLEVRAAAAPGAAVVLLSCPDLSVAPGLPAVLRPAMGLRCRALARAQVEVAGDLDVAVVGAERAMLRGEMFGADGFHPGALGHERLAAAVLDRLTAG